MTTPELVLIVSSILAIFGLLYESMSKMRVRSMGPDSGKRPVTTHRNLRLLGRFGYKSGRIYYQCFCLGPLPFAPIGCYQSETSQVRDITSSQKGNACEVLALYLRWGWVVAIIALLQIIL